MTLGEKIRTLRLARGVTQAELCDDVITRNMLSRIENGAALPSLPTLQHLANTLGVSSGYFLDEGDELLPYRKLKLMPEIKKRYREGDFAACLTLCNELESDDESTLITAECLYQIGTRLFREERMRSAESFFERAVKACRSCIYDLSHIEKKAQEHLSAIGHARAGRLPDFPPAENTPYAEEVEYYLYVYMLYVTRNTRYDLASAIYDTIKFSNVLYRKHINARLSLAARNSSRAISLLGEVVASFSSTQCDPLFRLNVLSDMESISNTTGNYEEAYKCLVMKNELLASFER